MDLFNSLSFQQSFIIAVAVSVGLTALLAWVYILLSRNRGDAVSEPEKADNTGAEASVELSREYLTAEVGECHRELTSAIERLEETLRICGTLSESIPATMTSVGIPAGTGRHKKMGDPADRKEGDLSPLNLSRELKELYSHVEKNRRKEFAK